MKVSAYELREMCRHMNYVKAILGMLPSSALQSEFEQRENREEVRTLKKKRGKTSLKREINGSGVEG